MTITEKILAVVKGNEGKVFSRDEIIEAVVISFPGTNKGSVIPSDYCYNKTNKGNGFGFPFPLFEYYDGGTYKYLGVDFPYTGKAFWKGSIIGEWTNGEYQQLMSDKELGFEEE